MRVAGTLAASAALIVAVGGCGGTGGSSKSSSSGVASASAHHHRHVDISPAPRPRAKPKPKPKPPAFPRLLAAATATGDTNFVPAVSWRGQTAVWVARRPGFTLLSFDQSLVQLHLHSGTVDAGPTGWRFGPAIAGAERRTAIAAFNGAFKLSTGSGGFESYGRVGASLRAGLGSIVTYSDGTTDIGAWEQGVPAASKKVIAVRQNLQLLISHGQPAADLGCLTCWGATLDGVVAPARSALGVTADGRLIWVGGEHLTTTALADALTAAHVQRAVELDINPEWVAGYLYGHRGGAGPLAPVAMVAGQSGIPGQFLAPWGRDFFSIVGR